MSNLHRINVFFKRKMNRNLFLKTPNLAEI